MQARTENSNINTPVSLFKSRFGGTTGCKSPCLNIPASPFLERLGYGTGVSVYLVERSPRNGMHRSPWAIKKINRSKYADENEIYSKRLKKEASILKELNHKNIVGFRAVTKAKDGMLCLALEDAEKSLFSMIEERMDNDLGAFSPGNIIRVGYDISNALAYLHNEKKLLHGDIKSGNVLIKGDFEIAKLCDFGVTLKLDENLSAESSLYVGTESWSAKEALEGVGRVTDRTDIFSYGIVIFEMLTLDIPHMDVFPEEEDFEGDEEFQNAFEEADNRYRSLLGSRPSLPQIDFDISYRTAIELFYVCTEKEPTKRPSASQIVSELKSVDIRTDDVKCKLEFVDGE